MVHQTLLSPAEVKCTVIVIPGSDNLIRQSLWAFNVGGVAPLGAGLTWLMHAIEQAERGHLSECECFKAYAELEQGFQPRCNPAECCVSQRYPLQWCYGVQCVHPEELSHWRRSKHDLRS
jgi:hypothetical protein